MKIDIPDRFVYEIKSATPDELENLSASVKLMLDKGWTHDAILKKLVESGWSAPFAKYYIQLLWRHGRYTEIAIPETSMRAQASQIRQESSYFVRDQAKRILLIYVPLTLVGFFFVGGIILSSFALAAGGFDFFHVRRLARNAASLDSDEELYLSSIGFIGERKGWQQQS